MPVEEKAERVRSVFDAVAGRYDVMNDLMSLGIHRLWKRSVLAMSGVRAGQRVLDVAGGTGDMTRAFARRVGPSGLVVNADVNGPMLEAARRRLVDAGLVCEAALVRADAESLPFPDDWFDRVVIAFGLRNVTDMPRALASMYRVVRPGGQLLVLEFSRLTVPALQTVYDAYSFQVLPRLGAWVAGEPEAYRYLAESIRVHPDQEALQRQLEAAGFERCTHYNFTLGVAALHRGYKL